MDIASSMYEIDQLEKEITLLNNKLLKHRKRKKVLMDNVSNYLLENDKKEIKVNGKTFILQEKVTKSRKKESDKKNAVANIIEEIDPDVTQDKKDEIYSKIKTSLQGDEKIQYIINSLANKGNL